MSFYTFPNGQTMSGKYLDNWTFAFNRQKYRWKRWSNATGLNMFIPENSSAERASVGNNLQNVSGVSRTVGWFGSPNGVSTVFFVNQTYDACYGAPTIGTFLPDPGGCGGNTDYTGAIAGTGPFDVGATSGANNPWNDVNLSFGYTLSSGGSEFGGPDTSSTVCPAGFWFAYKVRWCGLDSNRGACFSDCN
jgi:hypothetical protein